MNRRFFLFFITGAVSTVILTSFRKQQSNKLNGIWIPKNINWKDGSFNTIYIYNDTNFILIASFQSRNKNGTINFMSDQGFTLSYGHIGKCDNRYKYKITYRLLHRTIVLSDEKLPSDIFNGIFSLVENSKGKIELSFNKERYLKTNLYTSSSIEKMRSLKNKFVPRLLKENNLPQ